MAADCLEASKLGSEGKIGIVAWPYLYLFPIAQLFFMSRYIYLKSSLRNLNLIK